MEWPGRLLALAQAILGVRVLWRLARSGRDGRIRQVKLAASSRAIVAVVVPVLNEVDRLAPCLDGLLAQGEEVGEIIVADGGSSDGTLDLVRTYAQRDGRLRLVAAGQAPANWNGKVWGLAAGERALASNSVWVMTLDADVRPAPALAASLVAHARSRRLRLLSVATAQHLVGAGQALLHAAFLATLVYRFGRPGGATRTPGAAMANGQCLLIRRDLLEQLGSFAALRGSLCEDVTLARLAARAGDAVGFYESDDLAQASMYADSREVWRNWPRSLTTRDDLFGVNGWLGLLEVLLVQALPLPLLVVGHARRLNAVLLALRLGMLIGMSRAYPGRPITYWASPSLDLAVVLALWRSALRHQHTWRGRHYARHNGALVTPV